MPCRSRYTYTPLREVSDGNCNDTARAGHGKRDPRELGGRGQPAQPHRQEERHCTPVHARAAARSTLRPPPRARRRHRVRHSASPVRGKGAPNSPNQKHHSRSRSPGGRIFLPRKKAFKRVRATDVFPMASSWLVVRLLLVRV
jgi:hypothetical protein